MARDRTMVDPGAPRAAVLAAGLLAALLAGGCEPDATGAMREPERWTLVEELRIGSVEDTLTGFSRVAGVLPAPDGRVYVADAQDQRIRVFDADGGYVGAFGRRGQGPGETEAIRELGWVSDTLYVTDPRLRRVNVYEPDGRFVASLTLALTSRDPDLVGSVPARLLADGTAIGALAVSPAAADGSPRPAPVLRVDRSGEVVDTVTVPQYRSEQVLIQAGERVVMLPQAFVSDPLVAYSPDGLVVYVVERPAAESERDAAFRVTWLSASGDTIRTRTYPYVPVPLDRDWLEERIRVSAAGLARMTGLSEREAERTLFDKLYLPAHYPPVTQAVAGADGTLWLRREDRPNVDRREWLVLDAEGEPLGALELPSSMRLWHVTAREVWASVPDELDVPFVVRMRVERVDGRRS